MLRKRLFILFRSVNNQIKKGQAPRITIGGKRAYDGGNPLMLTDGSKRMSAEEYTPNSSSSFDAVCGYVRNE